jgi:hypothetical protein
MRALALAWLAGADTPATDSSLGFHQRLWLHALAVLGPLTAVQEQWLQKLIPGVSQALLAQWDVDLLAQHLAQRWQQHVTALNPPPSEDELPPCIDPGRWRVRQWQVAASGMRTPWPLRALTAQHGPLNLPPWHHTEDLAHDLGLPLAQLMWLSPAPWQTRPHHYRAVLRQKARGGLRLLEVPKPQLMQVQRHLQQVLSRVPTHPAAHGYVKGRGVHSHAGGHAQQDVVLKFDLKDFFHHIRAAQVAAVWRALGYPDGVVRCLTALTTCTTRPDVRERLRDDGGLTWSQAKRLAAPHLPQGAPTSPVLANLCAHALDARLQGVADLMGAHYSRYADDLVFSGTRTLLAQAGALKRLVNTVVDDEGWTLNPAKTQCVPAHRQQRVTGLVVNHHPQPDRATFDALRACLHQCARHGPQTQTTQSVSEFKARLQGQMTWVAGTSASRKRRLQQLFDQIDWVAPNGAT